MSNLEQKYTDELVDIRDIPPQTILRDWFEDGIRIVIVRSGFSMNTYLGVPLGHPLAGHDYDLLPVDCHGGLTFAGSPDWLPKGYYYYGYDYAHAGDYCWYDHVVSEFHYEHDKKWSLGEIVKDAWGPLYDLKALMKLAEKIRGTRPQPTDKGAVKPEEQK